MGRRFPRERVRLLRARLLGLRQARRRAPHSSYALYDLGRNIGRSRLKAGDLLFFYGLGHVGMYIGHGRMVHAPSSGRLVEIVKLGSSNYGDRLIGARRIVPR